MLMSSMLRSKRRKSDHALDELARLVTEARHVVFVTGAGISTNADIRDYRGPDGIWTEAVEKGLVSGEPGSKKGAVTPPPWDESMYWRLPRSAPTLTHRAVTALAEAGVVKHVITQNEDALHLRSGLAPELLSELHGNAFVEVCGAYASGDSDGDLGETDSDASSDDEAAAARDREAARRLRPAGCGAAYVRDFVTYHGDTYLKTNAAGRHVTRRACPACRPEAAAAAPGAAGRPLAGKGWLVDSTVDFGESPGGFPWGKNPVHNVEAAKRHMRTADLVVVWGSSLGILANYFDPWCPSSKWAKPPLRLATETTRRGKTRTAKCALAIVNRGPTVDEEFAAIKIDADVDDVARGLLERLGLPLPPPYDPTTDPFTRRAVAPRDGEPRGKWTFATSSTAPAAGPY